MQSPSTELTQSQERMLLWVLAAIQFTNIMDFMILMPLGQQLMRLFEISPQQFSFVVSGYNIAAGISGFASAFFIDHFDRRRALSTLYIGFIAGTLACGLAPNYYFLLAARILTGVFGGVLGALVLSVIGDAIPFSRRGRAMGLVMTSFSVASVIGVPFGLSLATHFNWHAPFVFLAGLGVLISFGIHRFMPSMRAHMLEKASRPHPFLFLKHIIQNPNQLRALSLTAVLMLGQFTIIPFFSPSMVSNGGMREDQLPFIYFLGGLATIFSSPVVGRLCDRIGSGRVFTVSALLATIPTWYLTHLTVTPVAIILAATTFFFVVGNGRMVPAMTLVTSSVEPAQRGGFMSINSSLQSLAAGLASVMAGMIVTRNANGTLGNYEIVGYIAIAASVICVFIARSIRPITSSSTVSASH